MTHGVEAVTTAVLGLALDAASLRQQAIAANIANIESADYLPVEVSFESQLGAARHALSTQGQIDPATLAEVQPELVPVAPSVSGLPPKVMLDLEVAAMARNGVQYQALVRGLSRHFAVLASAINEGRK